MCFASSYLLVGVCLFRLCVLCDAGGRRTLVPDKLQCAGERMCYLAITECLNVNKIKMLLLRSSVGIYCVTERRESLEGHRVGNI